jgi:mycothiol synthase
MASVTARSVRIAAVACRVPAVLEHYTIRPPVVPGDLGAVTEIARASEEADSGAAEVSRDEIETGWRTLDTERNIRVVEDGGGRMVAVTVVRPRFPERVGVSVVVAPDARGRGIGTALLGLVETRAGEVIAEEGGGAEVSLTQTVGHLNDAARGLLERNGYAPARRFWRMEVELGAPPQEPDWAEGIRVDVLRRGQERAMFDAMSEAFADHWGTPPSYEEWRAWTVEREGFDPSLWFLAWDGQEIAAGAQCALQDGVAWVHVLGVRRPWRRRGLGLALLLQSFTEFYERGERRVVLNVDSENDTGATRLYERAGMSVTRFSDLYEKATPSPA